MAYNLISVRDYLRLIFRRKHVLIWPLLLAAIAVLPIWTILPTKYRAKATVKRQDLGMLKRATGRTVQQLSGTDLQTLRVEILTWDNLQRVIRKLKLDVNLKTPADWQRKFEDLQQAISIKRAAHGSGVILIEITAIAETPQRAMDISNAIADNYVEQSKRTTTQGSRMAVDFLRRRVRETLAKVKENERQLAKYKEKYLDTIPVMKERILERIASLEAERTSRTYRVTALETRLAHLKKQLNDVTRSITEEGIEATNPDYLDVEKQLADGRKALEQMLTRYTEEHPDIIETRQYIERREKELAETPKFVKGPERKVLNPTYARLFQDRMGFERDVRAEQAALVQVQADIAAAKQRGQTVVKEEKTYNDLLRELGGYAEQYQRYSDNLAQEEARYEVEISQYGTQVDMLQRAILPALPYQMQRVQLVLACLAGGVAIGIGLMFTLEFCDHSLRSVEDATQFLQIPVLGCISTIVSPEERTRRHRRNILIAAGIVALVVLAVGALLLWEYLEPGILNVLIETARSYFT